MKIGELFIALGFKVDGKEKLDATDRGLDSAASKATKLTLGINAVNLAFLAMVNSAMRGAQALQNFALSTGLSTDELQQWQRLAAVNGVAAEDLASAVKALQTARSQFALGQPQNVGAWSILGVDPREDPFKVLRALRKRISGVQDVGVARNLLGQVGLESLLPLLRGSNEEFEKWSKNFVVNQRQIAQLTRLNAAWQSLKASIASVRTQFAVAFAPALVLVAKALEKVAELLARFTQWLDRGGFLAGAVRFALSALAIGLLALGAALAVITAALGALSLAGSLINLAALFAGLGPILLTLTAIGAVLAGLAILIEDIWVSLSGGDGQLAAIGKWIAGFESIEAAITKLWSAWDKFMASVKIGQSAFEWLFSHLPDWALGVGPASEPGAKTTNQNVSIKVDGAKDPRETGREIYRSLKDLNRAALDQAPVPNY